MENINFLEYDCQSRDNRTIKVMQEWQSPIFSQKGIKVGHDTYFDVIQQLELGEPTLRELLVLQSIRDGCTKVKEMVYLLENQPQSAFLYKPFLELDGANFVALMATNSKCTYSLLHNDLAKDHFCTRCPMIFKI